jgi:hypothetical protein
MMFVKKSWKEYSEGMPALTTAILGPGLHRKKEVQVNPEPPSYQLWNAAFK